MSNELIITLFHNLEKLFFYKSNIPTDKNYFICGLARSGSTSFLNMLYETGEFASFTYADMPFLFSPNLWGNIKKITGEGRLRKIERAHKDGIKIGIDSPEAFEESLWMFIKKKKIY